MLGAAQTPKKKPVVMKSSLAAPPKTAALGPKLAAQRLPAAVVKRPLAVSRPLGPLAQRRAAATAARTQIQPKPPVVLPAPPLQIVPPGDSTKAFPPLPEGSKTQGPLATPPIIAEKPYAWLKSGKILIGGGLVLVALALFFRRKK